MIGQRRKQQIFRVNSKHLPSTWTHANAASLFQNMLAQKERRKTDKSKAAAKHAWNGASEWHHSLTVQAVILSAQADLHEFIKMLVMLRHKELNWSAVTLWPVLNSWHSQKTKAYF